MDQKEVLLVSSEKNWYDWFHEQTHGCSGLLGGCEYCIKKMYQRRSTYLTDWLTVFITNIEKIRLNQARMPIFQWYAMPTTETHDNDTFHSEKCPRLRMSQSVLSQFLNTDIITRIKSFITYKECECDKALLLRELNINVSLDQIYPRFMNLLRDKT